MLGRGRTLHASPEAPGWLAATAGCFVRQRNYSIHRPACAALALVNYGGYADSETVAIQDSENPGTIYGFNPQQDTPGVRRLLGR